MSFWDAFELWRGPLLGVLLAALMCGLVGVYIVLKRIVFVGLAVSQMSGLGIAAALWVAGAIGVDPHAPPPYLEPTAWALGAAVLGAALFSLGLGHRRLAGESAVGLGYLAASALTLVVLNSPAFAQEAHEITDFLYGNAVAVAHGEVWSLAAAATLVVAVHALFFKELSFVAFDPETARAAGYRARLWTLLLYASFAVAVSVATRAIGMLPVFGLLVIPAAAALLWAERLIAVFAGAVVIALCAAALGFYVSWELSWPTGASIVVVALAFLAPGLARLAARRWA